MRTPGEASAPSSAARRVLLGLRTCRVGGSAVKIAVPAITATAETISAPAGRRDGGDHRGQQRAADEDQLDHRRVQRVGGLVQARLEQVGPHASAARTRSAGSRSPATKPHTSSTAVGAPSSAKPTIAPSAAAWTTASGTARGARRCRSTSRPCDRRADAEPGRQRARHRAGDRERAGLLAQVEHDRQRVDADRQPREQRGGDERADVRRAQDLEVAPHVPQASSSACSSTASIIAGVSLPVNVFCWLG